MDSTDRPIDRTDRPGQGKVTLAIFVSFLDENYLTAKYPAKPALELNLPSSRPSPDKNNLDLGKANPEERRPSLDLASSRLNLAGQNPESPGNDKHK